ncbi:MAG: EF-hand domain-containing protein [Planctomycetota bacterium]
MRKRIIEEFDTDGDGVLSKEEQKSMRKTMKERYGEDKPPIPPSKEGKNKRPMPPQDDENARPEPPNDNMQPGDGNRPLMPPPPRDGGKGGGPMPPKRDK